ncbi:MAG: hypothetical protein JW950_13330 [Deltaproteobacteria bacterium]|nr:hypothetical protein [Deltaproteobacteria bacterium]
MAYKARAGSCRTAVNATVLRGVGTALTEVARALKKHFNPKDILFSSLRGDIKHFHFHVIPLWLELEREWRRQTLYEKGHLHEFLGYLEKSAYVTNMMERIDHGWDLDEQRSHITRRLSSDVKSLRRITGYVSI